ncbi:NO-inducible flavohemoprotein [Alteribacter natronophilus]|uniref:NO-inducible flavohemoprotein n=1 Tax=Alteribacter natronophilus TaxID=2583810 RepID=UPI00110ECBCE|nr:NO-inducible flavohemoprotein [Alteribacter natronophilus]TMW71908.1 NO-inducible flavohemoprotein [Alteribacter natronophilus]
MKMAVLTESTRDVIRSTAPFLEQEGERITTLFYQRMFQDHPELLNIFNQTNQKKGMQPKALAGTLYAAAVNIDNLENLLPAIRQIAHKHRSLNVKPEHYPIVGEYLLAALKEVLGDHPDTDTIIEAWGEAYGVIADVFIETEERMYEEAEEKPGGWRGFREFTVVKKVQESSVITSFYLKPSDGGALPPFEPGQYISVQVIPDPESPAHMRQYSLSDSPEKPWYRISVKREEAHSGHDGGVVSNYLHENISEGDTLNLTAPAGDFTITQDSERPLVLIAGGVGLTPLVSMLNHSVAAAPGRPVTFITAAKSGDVHAMDEHLRSTEQNCEFVKYAVCYENPSEEDRKHPNLAKTGLIDEECLSDLPGGEEAEYYFCGPVPFMGAVSRILKNRGIPEERKHYEFFGPAQNMN